MIPKTSVDARLQWKCRRGLLELDLILQSILAHHYQYFSQNEKHAFNHLLEIPDPELLQLLLGQKQFIGEDESVKTLLTKLASNINAVCKPD